MLMECTLQRNRLVAVFLNDHKRTTKSCLRNYKTLDKEKKLAEIVEIKLKQSLQNLTSN